jgi:putative Ca2+/H+ antiporter (TMEM165/GDT1 family)
MVWVDETFDRHPTTVARSRSRLPADVFLRAERRQLVHALLLSFGVIFVAELGDKSQLMALAFAARYKALPILIGITAATALVHAFSVLVGAVVGASIPTRTISIVAAVAFFAFAAWTLRGDSLSDDEVEKADRSNRSAILAASVAFFLAELGDKTMLATITLATTEGALGTWAGSTLGMVAADALAIVVGKQLGARLPDRVIKYGAAAAFVVFGLVLFIEGLRG